MPNIQPIEDEDKNEEFNNDVPFDGFVNVNDIVKRRRNLRNADFIRSESKDSDTTENSEDN